MEDQTNRSDADQQKKVTSNGKDESSKENSKDNKDAEHGEDHEDEDIVPDESDDQKIKSIELENTAEKSDNASNGKMEEQLDTNDDVGADLEKCSIEEATENSATTKAHISDAQGIDTENEDVNTDVINTNNDSDDLLSNSSGINEVNTYGNNTIDNTYSTGYSLNSRHPKTDNEGPTEHCSGDTTDTEPETTKYVTDDEKLASSGSNYTEEVSGESKTSKNSEVMNWEDDHKEEKNKSQELDEPVPDSLNDTETEIQRQYDEPQYTDELTNNPQHQKEDDKKEVGAKPHTRPPESRKGTKITIKIPDTKSFKPENTTKPETVQVTRRSQQKQTTSAYNRSPATSCSNRSNQRPIKQDTNLSPRDIVAKQRNERRQKSQSACYPSRRKSGDGTISTASRSSAARSSRPPRRPKTTLGFSTERRRKEREFFHAELQRLKDSLREESKKIKKPKVRDHYPDVFTSLAPYYDTYTANYLINMPELGYKETQPTDVMKQEKHEENDETKDLMFTTRRTAIGLCDPWDSLTMDRCVLPKLETAEIRKKRIEQMHAAESNKQNSSPPPKRPEAKQGSTRLPKFPLIAPPNAELTTKELNYVDVPMLRDEMLKSFSHYGEERKKSDYNRTKQDFYRMELDRLDEYHVSNRPHMRRAYFAYLQNTPGSRKAIHDCMKEASSPKKKEEQTPQAVA